MEIDPSWVSLPSIWESRCPRPRERRHACVQVACEGVGRGRVARTVAISQVAAPRPKTAVARATRPIQTSPSEALDCPWLEMKPAGAGPAVSPGTESTDVSLGPPFPWPCPPDVRLCGHLRKQKSQRRRFFVLRADPPRLECYENEKKFLASGCRPPRPRRSVSLEGACTISKRADARQRHLIVVYTSDSSLGVAAASEAEQQAWYSALLEVRASAAAAAATAMGEPWATGRAGGCRLSLSRTRLPQIIRGSNLKLARFGFLGHGDPQSLLPSDLPILSRSQSPRGP